MSFDFVRTVAVLLLNVGLCIAQQDVCFQSTTELRDAVEEYFRNSSTGTTVADTYGHPIGTWCVSDLTDFTFIFTLPNYNFTESLTGWDTSSATSMSFMFWNCAGCSPDVSTWNTSSVIETTGMFFGARAFTSDISGWDVGRVAEMSNMFQDAVSFNSDISGWNVQSVTGMSALFLNTLSFNQDLSKWSMSSVTSLANMFEGSSSYSQNLCAWGPQLPPGSDVTRMFVNTSCPVQADPDLTATPPGPFCEVCVQNPTTPGPVPTPGGTPAPEPLPTTTTPGGTVAPGPTPGGTVAPGPTPGGTVAPGPTPGGTVDPGPTPGGTTTPGGTIENSEQTAAPTAGDSTPTKNDSPLIGINGFLTFLGLPILLASLGCVAYCIIMF